MAKYIYRGKTIEVPVWPKYISTDFDGEIAVSCSHPKIDDKYDMYDSCDRKPISWELAAPSVIPDWKESAQRIDELYIPWEGGDMPVPYGMHVDVVYRNGIENLHVIAGESDVDGSGGSHNDKYAHSWDCGNLELDIVAYRISKEKNPEEIAPKLWAAYKDRLKPSALDALKSVILYTANHDYAVFEDDDQIIGAFYWDATPQGHQFWSDVDNGKYDVVGNIDYGNVVDESYTDIADCVEDAFVVGDVVILNSGGPLLTVESDYEGLVRVMWFNESRSDYCHDQFLRDTLSLIY